MSDQAKKSEPVYGFLEPGFPVEVPPPVVIPLPQASPRPTIPRPVYPYKDRYHRDFSRKVRQAQAKARASTQAKAEVERMKKLGKLKFARAAPYALGFQIGWEIGDFLYPEGWYSFQPEVPATQPEYSHPALTYCPTGCTPSGDTRYGLTNHAAFVLCCPCTYTGTPGCSDNFLSAGDVTPTMNVTSGNYVNVAWNDGVFRHALGTFWNNTPGTALGTDWVLNEATPGQAPMPLLKSRPSEFPETFPLTQPMEMPYAQTWAEAIPKPKSQGEGKHKPQYGTAETVRVPLAPFPVVAVVPPGGTVIPPPDIVIDIPPPLPPAAPGKPPRGSPPLVHTRPHRGRNERKKPTREKKLHVRSLGGVATGAWIVLNAATEVFDFIKALHDALPEECRAEGATVDWGQEGGGKADPYAMATAVLHCWKYVRNNQAYWDKFMNIFINQQLTDMGIGAIGQVAGASAGNVGTSTGLGGAITGRPAQYANKWIDGKADAMVEDGEMTRDEANEWAKEQKEAIKLPIPTVSYDNGTWTVEIPQWGLTFT